MKHLQFIEINEDGPVIWAVENSRVIRRFLYAHSTAFEGVALEAKNINVERDELVDGGFEIIPEEEVAFSLREILCSTEFEISALNNWYRRINEGQFTGNDSDFSLAQSISGCFDEIEIPDLIAYINSGS